MKLLDKIKKKVTKQENPKLLFSYEEDIYDEWGTNEDPYKFKYYLKICEYKDLRGKVFYMVSTPDMSVCDSDLFAAINRSMLHMAKDSPRYYRLKERLKKQDKWKSLV